jgi:hypothetical protein
MRAHRCRPGESRDPERECDSAHRGAAAPRAASRAETFFQNNRLWLWVPAFAGTTK